jgi:hypothetical protein
LLSDGQAAESALALPHWLLEHPGAWRARQLFQGNLHAAGVPHATRKHLSNGKAQIWEYGCWTNPTLPWPLHSSRQQSEWPKPASRTPSTSSWSTEFFHRGKLANTVASQPFKSSWAQPAMSPATPQNARVPKDYASCPPFPEQRGDLGVQLIGRIHLLHKITELIYERKARFIIGQGGAGMTWMLKVPQRSSFSPREVHCHGHKQSCASSWQRRGRG